DSHPSLVERLTALQELPAGEEPHDDRPAISLLDNTRELEGLLFQHICGESRAQALKPITWEPVDREMTLADYEELVRQHARALKGLTPVSLSRLSGGMELFSANMVPTPSFLQKSDLYFVTYLASRALGGAIMLALRQAGWHTRLLPDGDLICTRGEETIEPFKVVQRLSSGRLRADVWQSQCVEAW